MLPSPITSVVTMHGSDSHNDEANGEVPGKSPL